MPVSKVTVKKGLKTLKKRFTILMRGPSKTRNETQRNEMEPGETKRNLAKRNEIETK